MLTAVKRSIRLVFSDCERIRSVRATVCVPDNESIFARIERL